MVDRRYGVNKYGDSKLYGSSDAVDALVWDVSIDWDENGTYDNNEADHLIGYTCSRGRTRMISDNGQGLETISTGTATVTLKNDDGRYDAWNTDSPLYPNVNYGKALRIRVKDRTTGVIYPRFVGTITDIAPSGYGVNATVQITAKDGFEDLRQTAGRVAMQQSIAPEDAIGYILDSVGWQGGRDLQASSDTISYWWASGNSQAISEIQDLADSFLSYFFISNDGIATFVPRTSITSSVADLVQAELYKDVGNPQPYEILRNVVRLKVHPRTAASTGTIWQLIGTSPVILSGASNAVSMWANYSYNNQSVPALNVVTPVASTDWEVNSQADGGGTDYTSSCSISFSEYGDTAFMTFTNLSGSSGYIITPKVRGDAIYEVDVSDVTYPHDPSTISKKRELRIDLKWLQDVNVAQDIADALGTFFGSSRPIPNVKMESNPAVQFVPELFDIVSLTVDAIGLGGDSYRVGGIEEWTDTGYENCQKVITRFYLEPYISADDYMTWDVSVFDTDTIFGW